jgi:zinc protease
MAVVVVGDVDAAAAARLVTTAFGAIPDAGTGEAPRARAGSKATQEPSDITPAEGDTRFALRRGPVWPTLALYWRTPARTANPSTATIREALVERLFFERLERKLLQMRQREHRPFTYASAGRVQLATRSSDARVLEVVATPDSLESGLAAVLTEVERIARSGVPASALALQKAVLLRQLESAAASESAIRSADYASTYVEHFLRRDLALLGAAQELAIARTVLPTIAAEDLAHVARFWRSRQELVVLARLPYDTHDRPPTKASVLTVLDGVARDSSIAADSAWADLASDSAFLPHPPTPGRIVGERRDPAAGVMEWHLSNGARVLFKPTHFDADQLLIQAVSPGGFSRLPDSLFYGPGRLAAAMMNAEAGVGGLDREQLGRRLATTALRELHVAITSNDESITLGGSSRDASTLGQLLYLQFTSPHLDSAAVRQFRQVGANLPWTIDDNLTQILARGDPRRSAIPATLIPFADAHQALAVYQDRFGNASDFTFIIVGAISPAALKPIVERYIASLPGTGQHETAMPLDVRPWNEPFRQTIRGNQTPKASTLLVFDGLFPSEPSRYLAERRRLAALGQVLQLELTNELRERMGGTYSVGVREYTYFDPEPHYRLEFTFDAAPERLDEMTDALLAVLDSVRARGAPAAELRKAASIQRRTHEVALQDNQYWVQAIERYDRLRIPFARISELPTVALTPEEIRVAAQQYAPTKSFIHLTVVPADTSALAKDSTSQAEANSTH